MPKAKPTSFEHFSPIVLGVDQTEVLSLLKDIQGQISQIQSSVQELKTAQQESYMKDIEVLQLLNQLKTVLSEEFTELQDKLKLILSDLQGPEVDQAVLASKVEEVFVAIEQMSDNFTIPMTSPALPEEELPEETESTVNE